MGITDDRPEHRAAQPHRPAQANAHAMVQRRALAASIGNHSFRTTWITAHLKTAAHLRTWPPWQTTSARTRLSSNIADWITPHLIKLSTFEFDFGGKWALREKPLDRRFAFGAGP